MAAMVRFAWNPQVARTGTRALATLRVLLFFGLIGPAGVQAGPAQPGEPVDYRPLAFYPERWEARKLETRMIPWSGSNVVFLTTNAEVDRDILGRFLDRLDGGWSVYHQLTGRSPEPFKQLRGKPVIAAVPNADLTCGYGCGFVGVTGIEVGGFYDSDYPRVQKNRNVFPHYYFYEMGRNYYTFGERHSCFVTGFAVFLRYVCMDTLGCEDDDRATRETIEKAEQLFAQSDMSWLQGFTMLAGLDEKAPRLKDKNGHFIEPSDQPVIYASAMLRLHRDCGGNPWLRRFFTELERCPEVKPESAKDAWRQSYHWLVAASVAARRDLSDTFADRWRLPLSPDTRKAFQTVRWDDPTLEVAAVLRQVPGSPEVASLRP